MQTIGSSIMLALGCVLACVPGEANGQSTPIDSNIRPREVGGKTVASERDEQESLFNYYFRERGCKYETVLAKLKEGASVPARRIPYSAAIHPESGGGMSNAQIAGSGGLFRRRVPGAASGSSALSLYDRAFNSGQSSANSYEIRRILGTQRALFPARRMRPHVEYWEGYCSGFTASTIKHPEPVRAVDAKDVGGAAGVVFQPADIKALLTCIYNRTTPDSYLYLAPPSAGDGGPNMGTFHLALANYIGQAGHPVGMDRTKGQVAWNNPVYAYEVNSIEDAGAADSLQLKTVQTTITYSSYGSDAERQTDSETGSRVGNRKQAMTLRYTLALDDEGRIVGGRAIRSSGHFLWIPLYAAQAKPDGSVPGNPYLDVRKVIALARASALPEAQAEYDAATIGPRLDPVLAAAASP